MHSGGSSVRIPFAGAGASHAFPRRATGSFYARLNRREEKCQGYAATFLPIKVDVFSPYHHCDRDMNAVDSFAGSCCGCTFRVVHAVGPPSSEITQ